MAITLRFVRRKLSILLLIVFISACSSFQPAQLSVKQSAGQRVNPNEKSSAEVETVQKCKTIYRHKRTPVKRCDARNKA